MKIKDIKYGIAKGGVACGLFYGAVVATVGFEVDSEKYYLSNVEFDGYPQFHLTKQNIYKKLIHSEFDLVSPTIIDKFGGISLGNNYGDIYGALINPSNDDLKLLKLLVYTTVLDTQNTRELIRNSVGKDINDIEFVDDIEDVLGDYSD